MAHLLVVDDEASIAWAITRLGESLGHEVTQAASAEAGLQAAQNAAPDVIFLDVRLPGMDGLSAIAEFKQAVPGTPVIIMTAYGDLSTAVEAVRQGAFEYLVKPFELKVVERTLAHALAPAPAAAPDSETPGEPPGELVGKSPAIQEVFKRIALVAPSLACVHICGESGTGKELVARAIHRYSRRSSGPFVAVNVAALSPALAESELFGHVQGAFTGAQQARKGLLEQADGGTIFLDEVADIPLELQVKLLRALEHGEVLPVGANSPVATDFRVVSATHQQLDQKVAEGKFRHDLFFRLSTFQIHLPPLRERTEDIEELARHFLARLAERNEAPQPALSKAALQELQSRPWHGNVRELRNVMEHAMILARGGVIGQEHLPAPLASPVAEPADAAEALVALLKQWALQQFAGEDDPENLYEQLLELVEPPLLQVALEKNREQVAAAARNLGLHRTTLRKKLDQYGLGSS